MLLKPQSILRWYKALTRFIRFRKSCQSQMLHIIEVYKHLLSLCLFKILSESNCKITKAAYNTAYLTYICHKNF